MGRTIKIQIYFMAVDKLIVNIVINAHFICVQVDREGPRLV